MNLDRTLCLRGHVIAEVGRYKCGTCKACMHERYRDHREEFNQRRNARYAEYRVANPRPRPARLPWEPLRAELARMRVLGEVNGNSVRMWARDGIPALTADEMSIRMLGRHPVEVYGKAWWA